MAVTVYGSLGVSRLQAADPRQPQPPPVAEDLRGFGIGMSDRPRRDAYEILHIRADADQIVVRAAYRALAGRFHPDNDSDASSTRRMAELNAAYAEIGSPERRAVYDALQHKVAAMTAASTSAPRPMREVGVSEGAKPTTGTDMLDFGRYHGWTISQIARTDPDHLRWLARHSSGLRYRRTIGEQLRALDEGTRLRAQPSKPG